MTSYAAAAFAIAFLSASAAAPIAAAEEPADAGPPRGGGLKPFEGKVAAVDRKAARVTLRGQSGSFSVSYDRDTAVYLENHLGTPLDIEPGEQVQGASDAADRAYWIAVRRPAAEDGGAADAGPSDAGVAGEPKRPAERGQPAPPPAGSPPPTPSPAPPPPAGPGPIGPGPAVPPSPR